MLEEGEGRREGEGGREEEGRRGREGRGGEVLMNPLLSKLLFWDY